MGEFYNFTSIELVHIGTGRAKIVQVERQKLEYVDNTGSNSFVDLEECARTYLALRKLGAFPPRDDTDWTRIAAADAEPAGDISQACVGLRAAIDEPPWFQFLNHRRTQFEFTDSDAIADQLLAPLAQAGWQSWDAS